MWFVYKCTENIIAEFREFYDTKLSEEEKKKFFIPTYDCMKKYQGAWHMEEKPVFADCFFIECSDREDLQNTLSKQQWPVELVQDITSAVTALRSEEETFLRNLMQPDTRRISMSIGYIKDGTTYVTQGPLRGRERFIRRIDRHKRLAWLVFPVGEGQHEIRTGLEIISKS